MQLHQLNKLFDSSDVENIWINALNAGDQILLIEDGILRYQFQNSTLKTLIDKKGIALFYLTSDAFAYGIKPTIGTGLSDAEWVDITLAAASNISW